MIVTVTTEAAAAGAEMGRWLHHSGSDGSSNCSDKAGVFTAVINGGSSDGVNRRSSKHSSNVNGGSNSTSNSISTSGI